MGETGSIPTGEPLAYFLTWTTYGSWLPGDERGWVDKPGQRCEPDAARRRQAHERMTEPESVLSEAQRRVVEQTIADPCRIRNWHLHAVSCRTQHVHVVVTAPGKRPDDVMDQFKAWCTRRLKEHQIAALKPEAQAKDNAKVRQNWWTQRASKRQLFTEASFEAAIPAFGTGQLFLVIFL